MPIANQVSISNSTPSPYINDGNETENTKNVSTPNEKKKVANAFDMIMSGGIHSSKKRKSSNIAGSPYQKSRFAPCPVGCGMHILPHEMNNHLDACLLRQATKQKHGHHNISSLELHHLHNNETKNLNENQEFPSFKASSPTKGRHQESVSTTTASSLANTTKHTDRAIGNDQRDQDEFSENSSTEQSMNYVDNEKQNNVFTHMMKRSVKVFSEQEGCSASLPKLFQQVHLHENGTVSLTCYNTNGVSLPKSEFAWSATVQVRGKKEGATPGINLLVSSSIPSSPSALSSTANGPARTRLVRHHSRLSVPVLKSILQKGIRRRKPLPSVRVASELADKSLGDLLRRLPIIVLEDSTLHPNLPFLVWLMVAVSKDYQPSFSLLKRVLGIVFEIASCRWQDSMRLRMRQPTSNGNRPNNGTEDEQKSLSLASLHKENGVGRINGETDQLKGIRTAVVLNDDELIVWSILMRGQYGGMACDVQMLQDYAELWHERFTMIENISDDVKKRLSPHNSPDCSTTNSSSPFIGATAAQKASEVDQYLINWNQVPVFVHNSSIKQSASRIDRLIISKPIMLTSPSPRSLQNKNQNIEGYSFVGLASLCKSDLTLEGVDFHCSSVLESAILSDAKLVRKCFDQLGGIDTNHTDRSSAAHNDGRCWLEALLKSCMWKYSGGVNFRLPLVGSKTNEDHDEKGLKVFYEKVIRPNVEEYSKRYIYDRLSKR